jgi:hypothetical protein
LRRRYASGLSLLANYTWAKNLANAPEFRSPMFESAVPQNNYDMSLEKGPACDIRHRFSLSAVYDLPAIKSSTWSHGTQTANEWFNPAAFSTPKAYTFGNVGRNTVYGPGMQTLDAALVREFPLSEKMRFQFRGEVFNALNRTNLGTPNRFVNTPQFGTITQATTPNREIQASLRFAF